VNNKACVLKAKYSYIYLSKNSEIFFDKLKLMYKYFYVFGKLRILDSKLENLFYDPLPNSKNHRIEYLQFCTKFDNFHSMNIKHNIYFNSYLQILNFSIIWVFVFFKIVQQLVSRNHFSYSRNIDYMINITYVNVIKPKRIYFFNYLSVPSYMSAKTIAKKYEGIDVYYVYTSGILYETCRYDSFENVNIIVGSKLQLDEIKYYQEKKWMKFYNCTLTHWGVDNIKIFETYSKERTVDIGLFSSGEWARPDGFLRGDNIEEIKNYKYIDNAYNKIFEDIVNVLVQDEYSNLKIKVYLHPYEKYLINTYNIYPPFWKKLVNCDNFVLDTDEKPSNFFESKLAIVVFSSIAIDRLDYDLDTLFFLPKIKTKEFIGLPPRKIYQSYEKYIYSDINELVNKLKRLLND
jgi:hypothetical protein